MWFVNLWSNCNFSTRKWQIACLQELEKWKVVLLAWNFWEWTMPHVWREVEMSGVKDRSFSSSLGFLNETTGMYLCIFPCTCLELWRSEQMYIGLSLRIFVCIIVNCVGLRLISLINLVVSRERIAIEGKGDKWHWLYAVWECGQHYLNVVKLRWYYIQLTFLGNPARTFTGNFWSFCSGGQCKIV